MVLWSRLNKLKKIQWGTILNYQKRKLLIETINEIQKKGWKKLYNDVTLKKVLIIMYNFHQNQSLSSWRVPLILKLSKKYIQHKRFSTHIDKKKTKKNTLSSWRVPQCSQATTFRIYLAWRWSPKTPWKEQHVSYIIFADKSRT